MTCIIYEKHYHSRHHPKFLACNKSPMLTHLWNDPTLQCFATSIFLWNTILFFDIHVGVCSIFGLYLSSASTSLCHSLQPISLPALNPYLLIYFLHTYNPWNPLSLPNAIFKLIYCYLTNPSIFLLLILYPLEYKLTDMSLMSRIVFDT